MATGGTIQHNDVVEVEAKILFLSKPIFCFWMAI